LPERRRLAWCGIAASERSPTDNFKTFEADAETHRLFSLW
jgi:hypothetical protein